ncbi:MAG: bifunctional metallophosphatase/5'-nucleotidase [Lachnospiraceae bacterium]|nr:bifunctional metallophosphatase/5'-nucleotidase [Lachnospiraceae bacterium]
MRKKRRNILTLLLAFILMLSMTACAASGKTEAPAEPAGTEAEPGTEETGEAAAAEETEEAQEPQAEKNGEIYILCTSDVHCGVDQGFGYAGLAKIRDTLEAKGCETILVDDGDSIQGEPIGTVSKGENIIDLMNAIGYDVAIPGNHEFDYGTDRFLELTGKAEFPYISCNFTYQDEPVFKPYVILEAAGKKIAFVGVTTPLTVRSSTPAYFMDDDGNYVYGFMMDESGEKVYQAVQGAVDAAREEGADFVFAMAHLGNEEECRPWTYADVIANTSGIDVFLDGHSHDTDQVVMKNKDGEDVTRSAVGTKMSCIGYTHISAEGEIAETGIWTWSNKISAPELLDIQGELRDKVDLAKKELDEEMNRVVATAEVRLTIEDPEEKDANGKPIRMVRRAETNLGDLSADAYRDQSGADIALVNGGGVRANIEKGDVTFGNIISVHPFGNMLCVIEVTGQQILDALEWGSRAVPGENGGFLQTSGLTYEINTQVDSPCLEDENGMFAGIEGTRRVQNVMVGEEPVDPEKVYTLASHNYMLLENGDGYTMFDGAKVLQDSVKLDNQVLIDYIVDSLNGVIGEEYADPFGQGRIKVLE